MPIEAIYSKDIDKVVKDKSSIIIDLRSKEDYQRKHIVGAYSIPYETAKERLFRLPKGKSYILYCEKGVTSFRAAREMSSKGYNVKSLINGFSMYKGKYIWEKRNIY